MIAYNKTLLENTYLVSEAINLKKYGFIHEADLLKIKNELETLKTSRNFFVRLGFLVLGGLLFSSILGLVTLLFIDSINHNSIIGFVFTLIGIIILEALCNQNYFRHGLDDAFLIGTQMCFCISVFSISESQIALALSMIVIGFVFSIRYVSAFSFLFFLSGIVLLVGVLLINYTIISSALPFVLLAITASFYVIHQKLKDDEELYFSIKS